MTASNFPAALSFVWRPENDGQPFHLDPRDPGGATAWGMTFATWAAWQRMHKQPALLATFRSLPKEMFAPVYRALFWQTCRCDELPAGVDLSVFDAAVGSGPVHAIEFLQHVLDVSQDGIIGPDTIRAALAADPARVVSLLCSERQDYYVRLPTFRIYGNGWDRRARDCRELALEMTQRLVAELETK